MYLATFYIFIVLTLLIKILLKIWKIIYDKKKENN